MTTYAELHPSLILDAIESTGLRCSGSLFALNSYENRVYQVGIEDSQPLIAKFYRPLRWTTAAILEEHLFSKELIDLEIPIIAPLATDGKTLHEYQGFRFAVFPRQSGRALELENLDQLEWMGRFIGRLHAVGACKDYQHRPRLDITTYGIIPHQYLIENHFIPDFLQATYRATTDALLEKMTQIVASVGNIRYIRLHGDCHAGNVLWNDEGPHIVDLDDSLMGPAIQDMWMMLSGDPEQIEIQIQCILEGYTEFHDFNYREIRLIEVLRTLRLIQYSAWLAKRWDDPAFPLAFPWFNTPHYWQTYVEDLKEQLMLLESVSHCEI